MNGTKLIAILMIVGGALAVAYGGFSYTKQTHDVKIGPLKLSVQEKKEVNIPVWAGVAVIIVGGLLLASGGKKG